MFLSRGQPLINSPEFSTIRIKQASRHQVLGKSSSMTSNSSNPHLNALFSTSNSVAPTIVQLGRAFIPQFLGDTISWALPSRFQGQERGKPVSSKGSFPVPEPRRVLSVTNLGVGIQFWCKNIPADDGGSLVTGSGAQWISIQLISGAAYSGQNTRFGAPEPRPHNSAYQDSDDSGAGVPTSHRALTYCHNETAKTVLEISLRQLNPRNPNKSASRRYSSQLFSGGLGS
ncbi:hypothetical protein B0H14DRAFT_3155103 [Mycena olivaceomarginata]|nr:hypothetical protein B0H14DRAFT_3155103 [Mycena olivaceomarginata]